MIELGVRDAASRIAAGTLTSEAHVGALLERIAAREPVVRAWAQLDLERVRAESKARDREASLGPLHGVAIGVKDVIDVGGWRTECNSPICRGQVAQADAACVVRLRAAGAVILGKTVTTEFAFTAPGPTTHPLDSTRTPGGSSSGSGAAVADRMVPAALGTQTGGSTIRPAAYCGIVGYKPRHARISIAGTRMLAASLDTIGVHARSVDDALLLAQVMAGEPVESETPEIAPKLVVFLPFRDQAETSALAVFDATIRAAARRGAQIRELAPSEDFLAIDHAHRVIMSMEMAPSFAREWREQRDLLSPGFRDFLARGHGHSEAERETAWALTRRVRAWFDEVLATDEVIATLSTPGEAPIGLASTGNAVFCRPWTLLHAACLHVPTGQGSSGLPLGVQLVSVDGAEPKLASAGKFLERLS